tara:strand:- start:281 stop:736 length:456 start_codon:yes stop_codon:yes gene_type:complete
MVFSLFIALLSANVMEKVHAEVGIAAINESGDNIRLDIYSINQIPIAGVQFEIQPDNLFKIDSISGGICSEVGFSLYSNEKGLLLGFSLQGKQIPKSTSLKINENILFSVYGKRNKDFINQEITLKTTLAGRKGNKVNTKVNKYIYTSKNN